MSAITLLSYPTLTRLSSIYLLPKSDLCRHCFSRKKPQSRVNSAAYRSRKCGSLPLAASTTVTNVPRKTSLQKKLRVALLLPPYRNPHLRSRIRLHNQLSSRRISNIFFGGKSKKSWKSQKSPSLSRIARKGKFQVSTAASFDLSL